LSAHGSSLSSLYAHQHDKCTSLGLQFVVIKDMKGNVFGGCAAGTRLVPPVSGTRQYIYAPPDRPPTQTYPRAKLLIMQGVGSHFCLRSDLRSRGIHVEYTDLVQPTLCALRPGPPCNGRWRWRGLYILRRWRSGMTSAVVFCARFHVLHLFAVVQRNKRRV
jgi:hypothetical protein